MKTETEKQPQPPAVAVLCVLARSVYKTMPGCDVYDARRDAFTFAGRIPVIAHPPCRSWGRLTHFVKADTEAEKALAGWCVAQVQRCGGVLEHPAHSRLFSVCRLPAPGQPVDAFGGWTLPVSQTWWGHMWRKDTWLYIVGVRPIDVPELPFALKSNRVRTDDNCSAAKRSATPPAFASWLVELAKRCRKEGA